MAINLQKGQRVDLTKGNPGLSRILIGLGWDPVQQNKGGGLFGSLFGGGQAASIDCDASVIMVNEQGKVQANSDVIYFGNLKSRDGSVVHSGDNLTGDGDGDDEQIRVDLSKVPAHIHKLIFVVNIYDAVKRRQDFGMIQNAFIRIVNPLTNQSLIHYNLSDDYAGKTSVIAGELYRHEQDWKFAAVGTGTNAGSLGELVKSFS
ncbi:TerD family protein [Niallia circulans]|uniref:TerD family protein n=1 Tax=Niallia circulans TaxID=1397 RepID=UPI001560417A|nr:TerD family protein [Niallia circulans]NRG32597.1 TerD family protein [Niallia circulans]